MTQISQYTLLDRIGSGVLGSVHRAVDTTSGRTIALKLLRLGMLDDMSSADVDAGLQREFSAVSRLTHPGIAGVYELRRDGDLGLIAMELVDGPTITAFVASHGGVASQSGVASHAGRDIAMVVAAMVQILEALAFAHGHAAIHRDLKPSNILVSHGTQAKITDFGMANLATRNRTETGFLVGTMEYMAPEQFLGRSVDARCDIHGAGVIFYELLTGRSPFADPRGFAMPKVLELAPPPPSQVAAGLTAAFDPLIARALAKSPADRFATAQQFRDALCAAYFALTQRDPPRTLAPVSAAAEAPVFLSPQPTIRLYRPPQSGTQQALADALERTVPERADQGIRSKPPDAAVQQRSADGLPPEPLDAVAPAARPAPLPVAVIAHWKTGAAGAPAAPAADGNGSAGPVPGPIPLSELSRLAPTDRPLSDASVLLGGRVLAKFLGPIAMVLSRKAAADARDEGGYFELLAAHLADSRERSEFLRDVGMS
jgi:eukaryotic-like serine/threonine-protein kinase